MFLLIQTLQNASNHFKVGSGHWVRVIGQGSKHSELEVAATGQFFKSVWNMQYGMFASTLKSPANWTAFQLVCQI